MNKNKISMIAMATGCLGVLLGGCAPREETVVVQQDGPPQVIEKETVKAVPEDKPKTIIVKPPAPARENKSETNVKVVVPTPKPQPAPAGLPEPAPEPTPKAQAASTPRPQPTATPKPQPKPTATPRPKSAAAPNGLVVRAEVISTSKAPDPKTAPYKDALIFTKYKVVEVENGKYDEKEVLVAEWAMKDKSLQPAARNRVGQVKTLSLEPLAKRRELESIMRSDDTNEFDLEPYFAK